MTREQLDAIRARVEAATPGPWQVMATASFITSVREDLRALLAEVERLRDAHAMAVQVSGELCEKCGWAMKLPGEKCRCELLAEVERLKADPLPAAAWVREVERAAFQRGVAAMRKAAMQAFRPDPFDYITSRIRALPDPEDTE